MAGQNNFAGDRAKECQRCLAMTNAERRLFRKIATKDPAFTRRLLESLAQAEPRQAATRQQTQQAAPQPAPQAEKATLLDKIEGVATQNLLAKLRKMGVSAAGITILYQVIDNIGDWSNGRDAASAAYGVITDNFTNWRAAVEPVKDVLSSPLVSVGAAVGIGFLWGRKAWRQLKKAWKAAAESVENKIVLTNEKVTERIKRVAEFVRSVSKTAFAALTCYHLPNLVEAGRSLVEVEPNSSALGQVHQLLNHFFKAAPGALIPVFAYILAKTIEWLMVSSVKGILEPSNNRKKEKLLEEQRRLEAGQVAAKAAAPAAPAEPAKPERAKPPDSPAAA